MAVANAEVISTLDEAQDYYRTYLVRPHHLNCYGRKAVVVFEASMTHCYSEESRGGILLNGIPEVRQVLGGKTEVRLFCLYRARLMDQVIPAICHHSMSTISKGQKGRERRVLHGPVLSSGDYVRVVLRPGSRGSWICLTSFPVTAAEWRTARNEKHRPFPP